MANMNLYLVCDADYEWGCFAFDTTRNRAKYSVARQFDEEYINMRCKTLKKCINIHSPMIVDCDTDKGYDIVLACGYHFMDEEESDAHTT